MVRALFLSFVLLFSFETVHGQNEKARLTKQQREDILRVTGYESEGVGDSESLVMPGLNFLRLSVTAKKPRDVVVSQGFIGSKNGLFYVFHLTGNRAVSILERAEGSMYGNLRSIHYGMHDFTTFYGLGGESGFTDVFEFDGKRYRSAYCYDTQLGSGTELAKNGPHRTCNSR